MASTDKAVTLLWLVLPQVIFFLVLAVSGDNGDNSLGKTLTLHPSLVQRQQRSIHEIVLPAEAFSELDSFWDEDAQPQQQARHKRQTIERAQGLRENLNPLPANSTSVVSCFILNSQL